MANSYLTLLALLVLAATASAQQMIKVAEWIVPYDGDQEYTANVGDTMVFEWTGLHNVLIHPTMSCDVEGAIYLGAESGTEYTFQEADAGKTIFFSCDIGNGAHCQFGQFLTVTVGGDAPGMEVDVDVPDVGMESDVVDELPMDDSGGTIHSVAASVIGVVGAGLALVV
jgi:plastocyanin